MSNRSNFCNEQYQESISMEQTVLVHEGDLQNDSEQYITTNGDGNQYLSILDSQNEIILNDMDAVNFENNIVSQAEEEPNNLEDNGGQVVLYRVDDSDELYGVQLLQDESGNLRKYQFKVRQTEEGMLEALPDTLQVLPLDDEEPEQIPEHHEVSQSSVFVKQEQNLLSETEDFREEENLFERDPKDTKEGILGSKGLLQAPPESSMDFEENQIFHEPMEEETEETIEAESHLANIKIESSVPEVSGRIYEEHSNSFLNEEHSHSNDPNESLLKQLPSSYDDLLPKEQSQQQVHNVQNGIQDTSELIETVNMDTFADDIEEDDIEEDADIDYEAEEDDDDDDDDEEEESEEYETIDGDHVTGDGNNEENRSFAGESIRKTLAYQRNPGKRKVTQNILRRIKADDIKPTDEYPGQFYYVVRDPEKENLVTCQNSMSLVSTNPRSVLKTSIPVIEPIKKVAEDLEKYDKRFAKSKEAQQARQFHNYIAHTKIIHAPIRQERLPRKQQIKPMERTDEEIVVQEVFVSSNGFVETSEDGVLKERVPLQATEFIQLSDTDDEELEKRHQRKRKSKKKPFIEITISDSDDEDSETAKEVPPKRPRGRPPKAITEPSSPAVITSDSSEEEPEEIIILRVDNKCPKCPKSFPSEGSLRSHMQCHVYDEDESEVNLMCEKCGEQFKNSALLNRHAKTHVTAT